MIIFAMKKWDYIPLIMQNDNFDNNGKDESFQESNPLPVSPMPESK